MTGQPNVIGTREKTRERVKAGDTGPLSASVTGLTPAKESHERVCRCIGGKTGVDEDVVILVSVGSGDVWVPMDTAARSVWVDREWFLGAGGTIMEDYRGASAADGHPMLIAGRGML